MKRYINVIDLDKTLIRIDSFNLLVKLELNKFDLCIMWFTFLRVLKLLNAAAYKRKISKYLKKKYKPDYFKVYSDQIFERIDHVVLDLIIKETNPNSINILLSASPHLYVKYLIEKLSWEGSGSFFNYNGDFVHLYGKNKVKWLKANYKQKDYEYHLAISDSKSDKELLSLFKKNVLWKQ